MRSIYTHLSSKHIVKTEKLPCIQNSWAIELHTTPLNSSNDRELSSHLSHIANQNRVRESRSRSAGVCGWGRMVGPEDMTVSRSGGMREAAVKSSAACYRVLEIETADLPLSRLRDILKPMRASYWCVLFKSALNILNIFLTGIRMKHQVMSWVIIFHNNDEYHACTLYYTFNTLKPCWHHRCHTCFNTLVSLPHSLTLDNSTSSQILKVNI